MIEELLPNLLGLWCAAACGPTLFFLRQILMPRIHSFLDRSLAGEANADARFQRANRHGDAINGVQRVGLFAALVRMLP